jgi:hypothetical protein
MTMTDKIETLDRARALSRVLADAIWKVDSAESLLRKAQPSTGYRSNPDIGDKPWNLAHYERQVELAHARLAKIISDIDRDKADFSGKEPQARADAIAADRAERAQGRSQYAVEKGMIHRIT